ncbi:MAG: hypothetical protein AB1454_04325 [Candidatus Auribacterota bacterium]
MKYLLFFLLLCSIGYCEWVQAETILLKNGEDLSGTVLSEDETSVTIQTAVSQQTILKSDIYSRSSDSDASAYSPDTQYTIIMKNGQVYEGTIEHQTKNSIKLQSGYGVIELDTERILSMEEKKMQAPVFMNRRVNVLHKDGEIYRGQIVEETSTFIRIQLDYGEPVVIDRNLILSIQADDDSVQSVKETLLEQDYNEDNYYKTQYLMLNEQIKVYREDIALLEDEAEKMRTKYEEKIAHLEKQIEFMEKQLREREEKLNKSQFPELIMIEPGKELEVNISYVKTVKMRVSEEFGGYFVGAEYTIYNEYVDVLPDFEVYFYNENGLNVGMDAVERKYTHVQRGEPETLVRGIQMTITDSPPQYFYIKIKK